MYMVMTAHFRNRYTNSQSTTSYIHILPLPLLLISTSQAAWGNSSLPPPPGPKTPLLDDQQTKAKCQATMPSALSTLLFALLLNLRSNRNNPIAICFFGGGGALHTLDCIGFMYYFSKNIQPRKQAYFSSRSSTFHISSAALNRH